MFQITYTTTTGNEGTSGILAGSEQQARDRFAESWSEFGDEVPTIIRVEGPWKVS